MSFANALQLFHAFFTKQTNVVENLVKIKNTRELKQLKQTELFTVLN